MNTMFQITGRQATALAEIADNDGSVSMDYLTPDSPDRHSPIHRTILVARNDGLVVTIHIDGTVYTKRQPHDDTLIPVKESNSTP